MFSNVVRIAKNVSTLDIMVNNPNNGALIDWLKWLFHWHPSIKWKSVS